MARIRKDDHQRILQMIEVEHRKVADVASEYGCSAANIYSLVARMRRETAAPTTAPEPVQPPLALEEATTAAPPTHAVSSGTVHDESGAKQAAPSPVATKPGHAAKAAARPQSGAPSGAEPTRNVVAFESPAPAPAPRSSRMAGGRRGGPAPVGPKLAKPGYGLVMRTPDAEDSLTPFRSLDDLLSAIKPILRAAASSPEPVWFSLQPVDLASIDMDAA